MPETILAKLRQEHNEIRNFLNQIAKAETVEVRAQLFESLKDILVPHMEGEEKTIYTHLREDVQEEVAIDIADELDLEHHELKEYLQRLNLMEPETGQWVKEFQSFKEHVEQHFSEEETELFDEAKEDFSRDELVHFAEEFEQVKSHPLA